MRKIHSSRPGLLEPLDNFILRYASELCEQGMVVTAQIVSRRASDLCRIFCVKSDGTKSLIVYRWFKAQGLRYRMNINESQCPPAEAASDALDSCRR